MTEDSNFTRWRRAIALSALAAISIFAVVGPAAAAGETGVGTGTGTVVASLGGPSGTPGCVNVVSSTITLTDSGTYTANLSNIVYTGPTTVTITQSNYFANPAGDFANATCTIPSVPATVTVSGSSGGGAVGSSIGAGKSCDSGAGNATESRVNSSVVVTGTWACDVQSTVSPFPVGQSNPPTVHTFRGQVIAICDLLDCAGTVCPPPNPLCGITGTPSSATWTAGTYTEN